MLSFLKEVNKSDKANHIRCYYTETYDQRTSREHKYLKQVTSTPLSSKEHVKLAINGYRFWPRIKRIF